jgi:PilZ domain
MQEADGERRKDVRARVALPAHVIRRGGVEPVEMLDASFRGLFIRTDEPPPERQLVKLLIELPTRDLEVHAVVVRLVVDPLGRTGVGLRFFALNGQDRIDWESFISSVVNRRATRAA